MKKICVITAARSEYGCLKWLMKEIEDSKYFELQIAVTGGHLLKEQGYTVNQIIEDGFQVNYRVDVSVDSTSSKTIAKSMGRLANGFAEAFDSLKPDFVIVLGDRYELLPICNTAFVMRIPIIHISGGDVTEGALDDGIRNSVTMLADYHFPGTQEAYDNIARMRGNSKNIWVVGEPGLDAFFREEMLERETLAKQLSLDKNKHWGMVTYHAETRESLEYNLNAVKNILDVLKEKNDFQAILTYANADEGGKRINEILEDYKKRYPESFIVVPSLGHTRYLSMMHQIEMIVGNSSSGIIEAPMFNIPVINVGNRQKGRHLCGNIIQSDVSYDSIKHAVEKAVEQQENTKIPDDSQYWGDGHTGSKIINILEREIK